MSGYRVAGILLVNGNSRLLVREIERVAVDENGYLVVTADASGADTAPPISDVTLADGTNFDWEVPPAVPIN